MSSWEVPFQGTTHKIWRRSDQNWGRRCDFCDSAKIPPKRQKNSPKIQKSKYRQSPMSCFEGPPEADSVKVWWRSDQNWGRRYVFVIFLKIHQKNSPKIQNSPNAHVMFWGTTQGRFCESLKKIRSKLREEMRFEIVSTADGALRRTTKTDAYCPMDKRPKD